MASDEGDPHNVPWDQASTASVLAVFPSKHAHGFRLFHLTTTLDKSLYHSRAGYGTRSPMSCSSTVCGCVFSRVSKCERSSARHGCRCFDSDGVSARVMAAMGATVSDNLKCARIFRPRSNQI